MTPERVLQPAGARCPSPRRDRVVVGRVNEEHLRDAINHHRARAASCSDRVAPQEFLLPGRPWVPLPLCDLFVVRGVDKVDARVATAINYRARAGPRSDRVAEEVFLLPSSSGAPLPIGDRVVVRGIYEEDMQGAADTDS